MYIKFAKLPVSDQDRAIEFYTTNLPCSVEVDSAYEDGGWRWIDLKFGNAGTMLHFDRRENDKKSKEPDLVLVDPNLSETVEKLMSNGVEIITERSKAPWDPDSEYAEFRDSEGNRMVLASA